MDKLVFLFHRKDGLTRQEFCDHYLDVHAPLGLRLTQTMAGYTVNLVDTEGDGAPDAITEVWTASMDTFFDPATSFATPEDAAELMADHDSFIGPYDTYVVEERVVRGSATSAEPAKRIACYLEGDDVPAPGPGVTDVVEQRVVQALNPDAPSYATIVSTWAPTIDALGPSAGVAYDVHEHRKLLPTG
jgi:EthD domain